MLPTTTPERKPDVQGDSHSELLVATGLDGSLMDEMTHTYEQARPGLAALAAWRVILVLASSKTRAEMEMFSRAMGLASPLIVENGGALLIPEGHLQRPPPAGALVGSYWTIALGAPREALVRALHEIAASVGAKVRSFAGLTAGELESITGLSPAALTLALEREYDEPFLLEDERAVEAIAEHAHARRLRISRGGRFWHLTGQTDKGRALRILLGLYAAEGRRYATVGLGDSLDDLPLLRVVDRPIVVPPWDVPAGGGLSAALPLAERAPGCGPAGWNAAVLAILGGHPLPFAGPLP
jgi:mannosyl-3-phosphoglycerate phosphatase